MSYPPDWRLADESVGAAIMAEHPLAHLITAEGGLRVTRVPFVLDVTEGRPVRLRGHLNAQNPQAKIIGRSEVLVVFSGPSTYVSPNWRTDRTRQPLSTIRRSASAARQPSKPASISF